VYHRGKEKENKKKIKSNKYLKARRDRKVVS
jgi:hypothetical protein